MNLQIPQLLKPKVQKLLHQLHGLQLSQNLQVLLTSLLLHQAICNIHLTTTQRRQTLKQLLQQISFCLLAMRDSQIV